jgi:predicted glycosyltransferase
MAQQKRVFYAVLNWGLGHATRSIAIIDGFVQNGAKVTIASDGLALDFLKQHYPNANFVVLPSLEIRYAKGKNQLFTLAAQALHLAQWYAKDRHAIQAHLAQNKYNIVLSDNRPGACHKNVLSIYITHQYRIKAWFFSGMISGIHQKLFSKYNDVWVPDFDEFPGLGGELSHPKTINKRVRYIGPLSDLHPIQEKILFDVGVILSGPEPQRSILEQIIVNQLGQNQLRVRLLRGTTKAPALQLPAHWQVIDFAERWQVAETFASSKVLVARSGYSTIMDLTIWPKPAVLIPTPGQPEQEYCAELQLPRGLFCIKNQSELQLLHDVESAWHTFQTAAENHLPQKNNNRLAEAVAAVCGDN